MRTRAQTTRPLGHSAVRPPSSRHTPDARCASSSGAPPCDASARHRPRVTSLPASPLWSRPWRQSHPGLCAPGAGPGPRVAASAVDGVGGDAQESSPLRRGGASWKLAVGIGAPLALGALLLASARWPSIGLAPLWSSAKDVVLSSKAWSNGFVASASLVLFSEIGDKTFFIAGLLAMQLGRWVAFLGAVAALALMSAVSVGIGRAFEAIPAGVRASLPMGEYAVCALLLAFGASMLRDAFAAEGESTEEGELADAKETVTRAEQAGAVVRGRSAWQAFLQVASLIFLAEWGDRSMLATIAMGATRNPAAVVAGATLGHAAATAMAVLAGSWAAQYISERLVKVLGGVTFLTFAMASLASVLLGLGA